MKCDNKHHALHIICAWGSFRRITLELRWPIETKSTGRIWKARWILDARFLPDPIPYETKSGEIKQIELVGSVKSHNFISIFKQLLIHKDNIKPFDLCCPTVQKEISKRTCKIWKIYHTSQSAMKNHQNIYKTGHHVDQLNQVEKEFQTIEIPDDLCMTDSYIIPSENFTEFITWPFSEDF